MSRFILTGFADEIDSDLTLQIETLKGLGMNHIEMRGVNGKNLCDYTLEEAAEVKKQLDENGFSLSAIGSPIGKIKITEEFEPHLEKFRHVLKLAELFEVKYIRLFSFYIPEGDDPASYRDEVLRRMAAFVEEAVGKNVVLLHENEKGIYGDIPERCFDILSTLNCPYLRATFDPANFVQCDAEVFPKGYELLAPYVEYLHIKDARYADHVVVPAGQGDGRVGDVIASLVKTDFTGSCRWSRIWGSLRDFRHWSRSG